MASTSRLGSAMLSRVAAPSTYFRMASPRTFSTSIAMRAGPPKDAPPARLNPLVGNLPSQTPKVKVAEPEPPKAEPPKKTEAPIISDLPPPPPPAENATASTEAAPLQAEHAYSATETDKGFLDLTQLVSNRHQAFAQTVKSTDPQSRPQVRAKAVTGRTVFIANRPAAQAATTPVSAINTLNRMIRNDHIKNKYHSQKFHERKGLKRKRLRSERWRARFKDGFKATVARVIELKKQGW